MRTIKTNNATGIQQSSAGQNRPGQGSAEKWLLTAKKNPAASLRLFCFSHAGGSAVVYHNWHKHLPTDIEVCAVQLPGRGHRMKDPLIDEFEVLVEAVTNGLLPHIGPRSAEFAFFGHSMGAVLAFEVTRRLRKLGHRQPQHLFVSGCRAPQFTLGREPIHKLGREDFIDKLRAYNGTPAEVFENTELMAMMEPILRADFRVVETRQYHAEEALDIPISAFGGDNDDRVSPTHLQGWREHTSAGFWQQLFSGDHFYHLQNAKPLQRQMTELICLSAQRRSYS